MKTPRRGFLKTLAVMPLSPAAVSAQAAATPPPSGDESVAEALAEAARREFGAHLEAADLEEVKKELARGLRRGARLRRAARLSNGDEPANLFEARPPAAMAPGERR